MAHFQRQDTPDIVQFTRSKSPLPNSRRAKSENSQTLLHRIANAPTLPENLRGTATKTQIICPIFSRTFAYFSAKNFQKAKSF